MAGQFVTILNPGYSTLYTTDLPYTVVANVDGSSSANPFNPDSTDPLQEGEWLTFDNAGKLKRAAADVAYTAASPAALAVAVATGGSANTPATTPCFMYFQERGRYDAQLTRKAHVIVGPSNYQFRTKMIVCAAGDAGERCYVQMCVDPSGRQVAALVAASAIADYTLAGGEWYAGVIMQVHGTNDATVLFQPGFN